MQINIQINCINYSEFCSRLLYKKERSKVATWLTSSRRIVKIGLKNPGRLKSIITDLADNYGASLGSVSIDNDIIINNGPGDKNTWNISITIEKVDYDKLADIIVESMTNPKPPDTNSTFLQIVKILQPFINETMATVPPDAITELLNITTKERVVEFAKHCGLEVAEMFVV